MFPVGWFREGMQATAHREAGAHRPFFVAQLLKDVPHLKVKHDPGFLLCHGCSSFCELIVSFGELIIVHMFADVNRIDYFLKHKVK